MSKTKVIQTGTTHRFAIFDESYDELTTGNYNVMFNDSTREFYLEKTTDFPLPEKIYGNPLPFVNRVVNTYIKRGRSMGVLLSGLKGTGKTVDMKLVCKQLAELGYPTVTISSGYTGDTFREFLMGIPNNAIILIDEFEKVYARNEDQNFFLSILDGLGTSNHLYILTTNTDQLTDALVHRPSRILYHNRYDRLDHAIVDEIIVDKCIHPDQITPLKNICATIPNLTIDVLCSVIDEVNMYNESPETFKNFFNIDFTATSSYEISIEVEATLINESIEQDLFKLMRVPESSFLTNYVDASLYKLITDKTPFIADNIQSLRNSCERTLKISLQKEARELMGNDENYDVTSHVIQGLVNFKEHFSEVLNNHSKTELRKFVSRDTLSIAIDETGSMTDFDSCWTFTMKGSFTVVRTYPLSDCCSVVTKRTSNADGSVDITFQGDSAMSNDVTVNFKEVKSTQHAF